MDIFELGKFGTQEIRITLLDNEEYSGIIIRHELQDYSKVVSISIMDSNCKFEKIDCSRIKSISHLDSDTHEK